MTPEEQAALERRDAITSTVDALLEHLDVPSLPIISGMYATLGLIFLYTAGDALIEHKRHPSKYLIKKAQHMTWAHRPSGALPDGGYRLWHLLDRFIHRHKATVLGDALVAEILAGRVPGQGVAAVYIEKNAGK